MLDLLAAVALVASGAESATTEQAADPIVCKKSKIPVVGTRLRAAPVCKRKSDWALDEKSTQRELNQINQRGNNPGKADGK